MSEEIAVTGGIIDYRETSNMVADVIGIIESAQAVAHRAVDTTLVFRNWLIGMRIVNEELGDKERSEVYGRKVVPSLARELTKRYGKGYSRTSLYQYVKFYRMFPEIVQTASGQSSPVLSWSHYIELLRVEDPEARAWYAREAAEQMWSVKTLSRNISTQWYHRLLATGFACPPTSSCELRSRNRNASLWRSRWSVRRCLRVRVSDVERYEAYVVAKLEGAPQ